MRTSGGSDNIAGMRSRPARFALVVSLVCTVAACQTPAPEGAKQDVKQANLSDATVPPTPDVKADASAGAATAATAGAATAATDTAGTATAGTASAGTATAGTATAPGSAGGPEPTPTTGPDAAATPPVEVDKTKLFAEVKAKKTSDARAKKALEEAEAGGATPRELAEASNARGVTLVGAGEAERAQAAFEWARDKDPTYPDASFNLAKQTANAGEIPATVAHLKEVHKRGGKTLLKQVGYDPTFEIVKDDPELSKLIK